MVCSISCSISLIFLIGMIYFYNMTSKSEVIMNYKKQLPKHLIEKYDKIAKERMFISYYGYGLGVILSVIIIFYNYKIKVSKDKLSTTPLICTVIATCFITNYFYYMLTPKSDWMFKYIKDETQINAWFNMYRSMQKYYHTGIVIGILAVAMLAFAFRC